MKVPSTTEMSAKDAVRRVANGAVLIDVRSAAEFAAEHVPGACLFPLQELVARLDQVRKIPEPRLLLCRAGQRAIKANQILEQHGVPSCVVIGGIQAYAAAGGQTLKGEGAISLERQVRVVAGLLVLLGVLLGLFLHPGWHGISAFVGAGLIFAGLTDHCGMGMLLSLMPWNKKAGAS